MARLRSLALDARRAYEHWSYVQQCLESRYLIEDVFAREGKIKQWLSVERGQEQAREQFADEFRAFAAASDDRLAVRQEDVFPQLNDKSSETPFDRHYIYHPAWAARILAETKPAKHIDISSILQFSTIVSAFVPVEFYDFRPAQLSLAGLRTGAVDLTALTFADDSVVSLSCMHVLEHIGLGRYGDALDPAGDLKAIAELVRVLAPGGSLLVATPVGKPRVQFNAHRVYDHEAFIHSFAPLDLVQFALIKEQGPEGLLKDPSPEVVRAETYGCGCFWFRKRAR